MEKIQWKRDLNLILEGKLKVRYGGSFKLRLLENNILENKCNRCGIEDWLGEQISLELDHIDGDNWNNKRENIRLLCPNCHAITDNYKGRNKKNQKRSVVDNKENIIQQYKEGINISQILKNLNLNVGGNYLMIYRILKENNIPILEKHEKAQTNINKNNTKFENKVEKFKNQIELIKASNIDFNKKGWSKEVAKLTGFTQSWSLRWIAKNFPEFNNKCWHHSDNKNIIK